MNQQDNERIIRPVKGLFSDTQPLEQIPGTYPYAKNGIQGEYPNAIINERGFLPYPLPSSLPYTIKNPKPNGNPFITNILIASYKIIGVIETDIQTILFLSDNSTDPLSPNYQIGNSLILYFDYRNNSYSVIFSDADNAFPNSPDFTIKPYKLNF